ncbi:uncharacterized protein FIBRA_01769 [Fibroporia radiculosa]|uniref:Uncharacterized protein n=1 Tax=Fibroporia radiculosa TaxID=599839 RepID=J4HTV4_9APHY|nr:uncharacterized protein FIBRA_01769 [Fibroporia radiculosa]CCL99747.1 predicted protein [Fibroporia radiculosa]
MPKAGKPDTRRPLPRRIPAEEKRNEYRKEVLCLPGPIELWLAEAIVHEPDNTCSHSYPEHPDEVWCFVEMQHFKAPDSDNNFCDGDTYILYFTYSGPRESSGPLILDKYEGWSESLDAPNWSRWPEGHRFSIRQHISKVPLCIRAVLWADRISSVVNKVETIRLDHLEVT